MLSLSLNVKRRKVILIECFTLLANWRQESISTVKTVTSRKLLDGFSSRHKRNINTSCLVSLFWKKGSPKTQLNSGTSGKLQDMCSPEDQFYHSSCEIEILHTIFLCIEVYGIVLNILWYYPVVISRWYYSSLWYYLYGLFLHFQ